jgi:rhodanese-related sulfurtransferase
MISRPTTLLLSAIILVIFLAGCNEDYSSQKDTYNISATEAHKLIEEHAGDPNFMIIDVRSEDEYKQEHLANAVNLLYTSPDFIEVMQELGKEKIYLFYCLFGGRSMYAMQKLLPLGFKNVYNLDGGIEEWKEAGFEVISE